jgi:hypothetical protein
MLKSIVIAISVVLAALPPASVAQSSQPSGNPQGMATETQADSKAWCAKDPRPQIAAFCNDLADFQVAVTTKSNDVRQYLDDIKGHPENLAEDLDKIDNVLGGSLAKLNLQSPKSVYNFITVMGPSVAANAATTSATSDALGAAGQNRLDRQSGPGINASGTTSAVSKAGTAELLSLALEAGAITRSVNGTTTTLATNADQLFRLVTGTDPDCTVNCIDRGWFEKQILNATNISANLDLAQQSSTVTSTSGQASGTTPAPVNSAAIPTGVGKLSGVTVRFEVHNPFDPRSDKFKTEWRKKVKDLAPSAKTVGGDTDAVRDIILTLPTDRVNKWRETLIEAALQDPTGSKLKQAFDAYWSDLSAEAAKNPKLGPAVSQVMQDRAVYRRAWSKVLDEVVGNLFTLEYNYNKPINQPVTHDLKLIYGYSFKSTGVLTVNGAISIYGDTLPAAAKYGRLHYGQISGQYDRTLSGKDKAVQTQLSLAGYWQYQPNPSVLNLPAGTVAPGTDIPLPNGTQEFVGTAGSLWVAQAKLTIKGSGGISVPIGVSWSNKTDLLQGSKVGAQVGINYNFSSLAGLFSGGNR